MVRFDTIRRWKIDESEWFGEDFCSRKDLSSKMCAEVENKEAGHFPSPKRQCAKRGSANIVHSGTLWIDEIECDD